MPHADGPGHTDRVPVDLAAEDWVLLSGSGYFFEPWGATFTPPEAGSVLVAFGDGQTRFRGVEVSTLDDGRLSIWMPSGSTAYWLAHSLQDDAPWERHLVALDYERGQLA